MTSPLSSLPRAALGAIGLALALGVACSSGDGLGSGDAPGDAGTDSAMVPAVASEDASPLADAISATDYDGAIGSDATSVSPDLAPPPTLTAIAPTQAIVNSAAPTVTCTGAGFVVRSVIQVNGVPLATSFVSSTELAATLPNGDMTATGTLNVTVGTGPPGGGGSAAIAFQVVNPTPTITALDPTSTALGAGPTLLTVTGDSFVAGATLSLAGTTLAATLVSATNLTATLPASVLATSGLYPVTVTNPAPGGGTSTSIPFVVSNPDVTVSSVTPSTLLVGGPATPLTLVGSGFVAASAVSFDGTAIPTTFTSATSLTATVPASALLNAGAFPVTVTNPSPGGGTSAPLGLTVDDPSPTITAVTPSSAVVPAGDTPITVTGTGIVAGASLIQINGTPVPTTYAGGVLGATVPAADLGSATTLAITIANPAPGGGTSNAVSFVAADPVPAITSATPSSITVMAAATPLTLTGTGFVAGATVQANGTSLTVTAQSATSLTATVPAAMLTTVGTLSITVTDPAPGGGTSAPFSVPIGCNTSGASVVLSALSTPTTLALNFTGAPTAYRITTSEQNDLCPSTDDTSGTSPYLGYVVINDTGASATLSAWAVCKSTDDAFLTFYPGSTIPTTQAQLEACTGYVAEGKKGAGGLNSTQAGGSEYCPGLAGTDGGLTLAACATAVVLIQPYSGTSQTYTPPSTLVIELQ